MARDRKRAKQRKERQARSGVARRAQGGASANGHEHEAPELASGEVDLSEAQLALGRPELADAAPAAPVDAAADAAQLGELSDEDGFEALEDRVDDAEEHFEHAADGEEQRGEVIHRTRRKAPATREHREGGRLANFLRGSWRELERVQWPDRRQVGQATAVVIGFVIVAGAFLGLMDLLASKVVDFIV